MQLDIPIPEEVLPIVNIEDYKPFFDTVYRFKFSKNGRHYFRKGVDFFYSGITNPINKVADKTYLNKVKVDMAKNGEDADFMWGEKMNYGTAFHALVSYHERVDDTRIEFIFHDDSPEGWMGVVKQIAEETGYPHEYKSWCSRIQNDMACWFNFKKEKNVKVLASELCVWHDGWRLCTPLDLVVEMDFGAKKRIVANINIKTGTGSFGSDYIKQVALEHFMFNEHLRVNKADEKLFLEGTFLWSPKDRDRSPAQFNLSPNYWSKKDGYKDVTMKDFQYLADTVRYHHLDWPSGTIRIFNGKEDNFTMKEIKPLEYLEIFNKQK